MEIVCEGYKKSMRKDSDNAKLLEPGELPSKRKILVVEDNELNRDILSSFLEEKFDVFLAVPKRFPICSAMRSIT